MNTLIGRVIKVLISQSRMAKTVGMLIIYL